MQFSKQALARRLPGMEASHYLVLIAAFFTFMGIALGPFGSYLFEEVMIIPCVLFLRAMLCRPLSSAAKKALTLSCAMLGWFLILQLLRDLAFFEVYPFSTYFCSYLFAFPMAALLQDGDKRLGLKMFGIAFIAAASCHAITALLLLLDWVPAYFTQYHAYWDGTRLNPFWHPNMAACFIMFGIASCLAFLQDTKKRSLQAALLVLILVLLATMAVTNCRTVVILTGGLLGGAAFFALIRGRWKLAPIGLVLALAILVVVYTGSSRLYQANCDRLLENYITETISSENTEKGETALVSDAADTAAGDDSADIFTAENIDKAESALAGTSGQGSLINDLATLNSRSRLWKGALEALNANRMYYLLGVDNPGKHMSYFSPFAQTHTHNSWVETLLGLGVPGFAIAMVFTLLTLWNGIVILLKYPLDVWKRTTAMLTLCMLVASFMEPYLFLPPIDYYLYNFIFLLCAGYLACWQEEDNRKALQAVRRVLHI